MKYKNCLVFFVMAFVSCTVLKNQRLHSAIEFPALSLEAHRGGKGLMPENTIAAMINAMSFPNVTTLEMDIHITKDKKVVVTHDDYLNPAFVLTPDGKDLEISDSKKYRVYGLTYDELKRFDTGSKFYAAVPRQQKQKSNIPLLEDLIDSVQAHIVKAKRKQVFYNIETKCSLKGDGKQHPGPEEFVDLLMDVIRNKNIERYVVIQSFDKRTIQVIRRKYPSVRTSYLVSNSKTYEQNIQDLGFRPFILSPNLKMVDADLIAKAHRDGVKVIPWTVNTKVDIERLKKRGVDAIIYDYPDLF